VVILVAALFYAISKKALCSALNQYFIYHSSSSTIFYFRIILICRISLQPRKNKNILHIVQLL